MSDTCAPEPQGWQTRRFYRDINSSVSVWGTDGNAFLRAVSANLTRGEVEELALACREFLMGSNQPHPMSLQARFDQSHRLLENIVESLQEADFERLARNFEDAKKWISQVLHEDAPF